jgi:hypothetical protein
LSWPLLLWPYNPCPPASVHCFTAHTSHDHRFQDRRFWIVSVLQFLLLLCFCLMLLHTSCPTRNSYWQSVNGQSSSSSCCR